MLIVERPVPRHHWEPLYRMLTRQVQRGNAREVGIVRGVMVYHCNGTGAYASTGRWPSEFYFVVDVDYRPVSWMMLWHQDDWAALEVVQLWTFPAYRGAGNAARLYHAAIDIDDKLIMTGSSHSTASRKLWESFIRKQSFNIWAHEINELEETSDVYFDDGELQCSLPLYDDNDGVFDVRLVANRRAK